MKFSFIACTKKFRLTASLEKDFTPWLGARLRFQKLPGHLVLLGLILSVGDVIAADPPEFDSNPAAGSTLTFPDQLELTEGQKMIIQVDNLGAQDLILNCSITGVDNESFVLKACPPTVGRGERVEVSASCDPMLRGQKSAILQLETNDSDESLVVYPLLCTGLGSAATVKVTFPSNEADKNGTVNSKSIVKHKEDMDGARRTVRATSCTDCENIRPKVWKKWSTEKDSNGTAGNGTQCTKYADIASDTWHECDFTFGSPVIIPGREDDGIFFDPCYIDSKPSDCNRSYSYQATETVQFADFDSDAGVLVGTTLGVKSYQPKVKLTPKISGPDNPFIGLKASIDSFYEITIDAKVAYDYCVTNDKRQEVCGDGDYSMSRPNIFSKNWLKLHQKRDGEDGLYSPGMAYKYYDPAIGRSDCSEKEGIRTCTGSSTYGNLSLDRSDSFDVKADYEGAIGWGPCSFAPGKTCKYIGKKKTRSPYGPSVSLVTQTHVIRSGYPGTDQPMKKNCLFGCENNYKWPDYPDNWTRGPGCGFSFGMTKCDFEYTITTNNKTKLLLTYEYSRLNFDCTGDDCEPLRKLWEDPCHPYPEGCVAAIESQAGDQLPGEDPAQFGLIIEVPSTVLESGSMEIQPDSIVNINSRFLNVALLSNSIFDATAIDASSVSYGPGRAKVNYSEEWDIDSDGTVDLMLEFYTEDTGITCHNKRATIKGDTLDLNRFVSSHPVNVILNNGELKGNKTGSSEGKKGGWITDTSFCRDS
jgi:hypothetical protein